MAGMYELPPLPLDVESDAMAVREPLLRVRHAITNTNYYVRVYAPTGPSDKVLRRSVPLAKADLHWVRTSTLTQLPLTGLCRKVLQRLDVMAVRPLRAPKLEHQSLKTSQMHLATQVIDEDEDHDAF